MTDDVLFKQREFLRNLDLGDVSEATSLAINGTDAAAPIFDAAKEQSIVVGSEVVSFTEEVEVEYRQALSDSALVAQLGANAKVDPKADPIGWFDAYFNILGQIGWVTQVRDTADYKFKTEGMEVHEAITEVVVAFLGPMPGAAALVKLALDQLKSMDKDSPWITLFNRKSEHAKVARFQFTLIRRGEDNILLADAMCFAISAEKKITQVLFFKASKTKTHMQRSLGTVSIGTDALDGLRPILKQRVAAQRAAFLLDLPLSGGG
jgi:hypothetical protein